MGAPCKLVLIPGRTLRLSKVVRERLDWNSLGRFARFRACVAAFFGLGPKAAETLTGSARIRVLKQHEVLVQLDAALANRVTCDPDSTLKDIMYCLDPQILEIRAVLRAGRIDPAWHRGMFGDLRKRVNAIFKPGALNESLVTLRKTVLAEIDNVEKASAIRTIPPTAQCEAIELKIDLTPGTVPLKHAELAKASRVEFGDMHGNCLMLLNKLVQGGFLEITNASKWHALSTFLSKLTPDASVASDAKPQKCELPDLRQLLNQAVQPAPDVATRQLDLLGDLLADRRGNTLDMLCIIDFLHRKGIPFAIPMSNHDQHCVHYHLRNRAKPDHEPYTLGQDSPGESFIGMKRAHDQITAFPAQRAEFRKLMKSYLEHLNVLIWDDANRHLYCHGVVNAPIFDALCELSDPEHEGFNMLTKVASINEWWRRVVLADAKTMQGYYGDRDEFWLTFANAELRKKMPYSPLRAAAWNVFQDQWGTFTDHPAHPFNTDPTLPEGCVQVIHGHCTSPADATARKLADTKAWPVAIDMLKATHGSPTDQNMMAFVLALRASSVESDLLRGTALSFLTAVCLTQPLIDREANGDTTAQDLLARLRRAHTQDTEFFSELLNDLLDYWHPLTGADADNMSQSDGLNPNRWNSLMSRIDVLSGMSVRSKDLECLQNDLRLAFQFNLKDEAPGSWACLDQNGARLSDEAWREQVETLRQYVSCDGDGGMGGEHFITRQCYATFRSTPTSERNVNSQP